MKTAKLIFIIVIILAVILSGGAAGQNKVVCEVDRNIFSYDKDPFRSWYLYIMDGFGQEDIAASVRDSGMAAEYRVVYDASFVGVSYYSLQVYGNGTGRFTFMAHLGEDFEDTEQLLLCEARNINKYDTDMLLKAITDNDFWNIPTVHPDEKKGFDGATVFIEGSEGGNTHYIRMWYPDEKYGIYKILKAYSDYSIKIADNPLEERLEIYEFYID